MKRVMTTLLMMISLCWASTINAQQEESSHPDFKTCFKTLERNRVTYNRYNDSIFLIRNHDEWIRFFQHRAEVYYKIYSHYFLRK